MEIRNPQTLLDYPRHQKILTTRWVIPGWYGYSNSTSAWVANRIYYTPIFVDEPTAYDRIGMHVTTPGVGVCDLRVFAWDNGLPGALILAPGTVDVSGVGLKEVVIALTLPRGYYYLASRSDVIFNARGLSPSVACFAPCPGISSAAIATLIDICSKVDAIYSDPAPAPDFGVSINYAGVYLREG